MKEPTVENVICKVLSLSSTHVDMPLRNHMECQIEHVYDYLHGNELLCKSQCGFHTLFNYIQPKLHH